MSYEIASTIMTVVMFAVFLGIVAWAWNGRQRDRFDAASRLPLEEELELTDAWQFQERRK
jgi:cytochrome c oxidase cbb3-type subunit IV